MFEAILEDLQAFQRIIIHRHGKPDGDAIGSCTALYHFIRQTVGSECRIVLNDRHPAYLDFLTGSISGNDIIIHEENEAEAVRAISGSDLVICLDFNPFPRTDKLAQSLTDSKAEKVLIDHHLNPDKEKFALVFSETEISSASELLYHILMGTEKICGDASRLPQATATALMTGMTTDTNNFANSVFPSTLHMASALLAAGTDRNYILDRLYNQFSENRLRIMGHMMKDLLTITEDGVAYIVLDKETMERYCTSEGDTEGFVNMPLSIADVRMSILAKEDNGRIRISIRSKRGTSANMCARMHFNGGGHENAAGGRLLVPENVKGIEEVGEYIERVTHIFLNDNEDN